jgi:hypothetical protein
MAFLGDLLGVAHVLKRAYDLYEGCAAAPDEIRLAREHIHAMTLCLEGVRSDLLNNPRSFVHQQTATAKSRTHNLKVHVGTCEKALKRTGELLGKYHGFKGSHVKFWDRYRWSTAGKKEIAECKSDLVFATSVLDMFLSGQSLNVLVRVEEMVETLVNRIAGLEALLNLPTTVSGQNRPRAGSNVGRTLIVSLVVTRLMKFLETYRQKKLGTGKKPQSKNKHMRMVTRTNSGFANSRFAKNTEHEKQLYSYASDIAMATPPPPYTPTSRVPRPRTPSPDFHYIPGGTPTSPRPGLIRRTSSLNRLSSRSNAKVVQPRRTTEQYECWKVGEATLAIGLKGPMVFLQHKRGQMQLRKMGEVFREASAFDSRALTEKDRRVKEMLKEKNRQTGKGGKKWYFVSGRVIKRDPGKTGMVSVEKALVILVKR